MKRNTLLAYGCTALLLSACGPKSTGSGGGGGGTDNPAPVTGTVSGKVVDNRGNPLANTPVLLVGASGQVVTTTDGSGAFSFADVAATYDIAAARSDKTAAILYKGATSRSITLHVDEEPDDGGPGAVPHSATLKGAFSGGKTPYSGTNAPALTFYSSQGAVGLSTSGGSSTTGYTRQATWVGPTSLTGSLFALQSTVDTGTGLPTGYPGYGRRDNITLGDGATVASQDVHLDAVANATLALNLAVPTGLQLLNTSVDMVLPEKATLSILVHSQPSGASFNYLVPQVSQATFSVSSVATEVSKGGFFSTYALVQKAGLTAGSTTSLSVPDLARPTEPADSSMGVTHTTNFAWSPVSGGLYAMMIKKTASSSTSYALTVFTTDPHASLPDLSPLGVALPASTSLTWSVEFVSTFTTVDSILQVTGDTTSVSDLSLSVGPSRTFTTAATP